MVISWWFTMVQSVIKSPTKKSKMSILHLKEQTQFHHESSEDFMTYIQHLLIPSFPKTNCWWTKNTACHANSRNSAFQLLEIGHIVHQTSQLEWWWHFVAPVSPGWPKPIPSGNPQQLGHSLCGFPPCLTKWWWVKMEQVSESELERFAYNINQM